MNTAQTLPVVLPKENDKEKLEKVNLIQKLKDTFKKDPEKVIMIGLVGLCCVCIFAIGGILATGLVAGIICGVGETLIFLKMKEHAPRMWNTMLEHQLATDLMITGLVWTMAPTGTIGIIIAGTTGLFASVFLKFSCDNSGPAIDPITNEPYKPYSLSLPKLNVFGGLFEK